MNQDPRWVVEIDKAQFDNLKLEERFCQLVALARAVNALRFVHTALLRHETEDDSPEAQRTIFNSFFFNCALLYEALLLVERLGKHFRNVPEFGPLRDILRDRTAIELRNSSLTEVRNKLTFHFSEDEIRTQLMKQDIAARFAASVGTINRGVYYELADACTLGAFLGLQLDATEALDGPLAQQIEKATDVAVRFMDAAENFIASVLKADGWELHLERPAEGGSALSLS